MFTNTTLDSDLSSGAPTSKRRKVDRRSARKSKREEAKTKKSEYFTKKRDNGPPVSSSGPSKEPVLAVKKRPAPAVVPENRPAKRPKLKDEVAPKPETKPSLSTPASSDRPKARPTALERLVKKQSAAPMATSKSRQKDAEDDEIAWLEAKLGIRSKKGVKAKEKGAYGTAFSADGLDGELPWFWCRDKVLTWRRYPGRFG